MGGTADEKKKKEKESSKHRKKRKRDAGDGDDGDGSGADDRAEKKKGKHHRKEKKKKKHKHKHKKDRKDEKRTMMEGRRGKHDRVKDEDEDPVPTDPSGSGEVNGTELNGGSGAVGRTVTDGGDRRREASAASSTTSAVKKEEDETFSPSHVSNATDGENDRGEGGRNGDGHHSREHRVVKEEQDEEDDKNDLDLDLDRDHDDDDGIEYVDDDEEGGDNGGKETAHQPPSAMRLSGSSQTAASPRGAQRVVGFSEELDAEAEVGGEEGEVEVRLTGVSKPDPARDPIVVSFPNGVPRSVVGGGGDGRDNANAASRHPPVFRWYQRTKTSRRGKAIHGMDDADVGTGGVCSYDASNLGRGYDDRLTMLYVGVYDKVEKTVQLIPAAEKGTVFALRQRVRSAGAEAEGAAGVGAGADVTPSTWGEKRQALFADFGSTKKQRVLKSAAANKVTADSVVGGVGNVSLADASMVGAPTSNGDVSKAAGSVVANGVGGQKRSAVEVAMEEARRNFLPPFDPDATMPHKVYDLTIGIAGGEAWDHIVRVVDICLDKGGDDGWIDALTCADRGSEKPHWPKVLMDVLRSIGGSGGDESKRSEDHAADDARRRRRRIRLVLLLRHVVEFHSAFPRTYYPGTSDDLTRRIRSVPRKVSLKLLDLFASPMESDGQQQQQRGRNRGGGGGFSFTKPLRDKLLIHALLLYLAVHGDAMKVGSIDDFLKELELDPKHAASLLRQAGCTATKMRGSGGGMSVSLRVPLIFPQPKKINRS